MTRAEEFIDILERLRHLPSSPAFNQLFELGLTPTHLRAMQTLHQQPQLPMKDLAEQLNITPPSVTALTRRLVALKLLERQPDPDDNRKVLLALSAQGTVMFTAMHEAHRQRIEQLLSGLDDREQDQLVELMERAVSALESALAGGTEWNESSM